jgi:hypothetical protein
MEEACINQALSIMMNEIKCLREKLGVQLWGRQIGFIRVQGDKINFPRPRVRRDGGGVKLETHEKMQAKRHWGEDISEMVLGGLATRQFYTVAKAFRIQWGLSKSEVSSIASYNYQLKTGHNPIKIKTSQSVVSLPFLQSVNASIPSKVLLH